MVTDTTAKTAAGAILFALLALPAPLLPPHWLVPATQSLLAIGGKAAYHLPEDLTAEAFRRDFGGVGDERYRLKAREIEAMLDRCAGLGP